MKAVTIEAVREAFIRYGYTPDDESLRAAAICIDSMVNEGVVGQAITGLLMEGPTGTGKSSFTQAYVKVLEEFIGEPVERMKYACIESTGTEQLFEVIHFPSAVTGETDKEKIMLPGILARAIKAVNEGKRVILVLDEYDKTKKETDGDLLDFMQEGELDLIQLATQKLAPDKRKNLQVIILKNYNREVSEEFLRRFQVSRLKHMTPDRIAKIIEDDMPNADQDIKDIIKLLYAEIYKIDRSKLQEGDEYRQGLFKRMPALSEAEIAIQNVGRLIRMDAPSSYIYNEIFSNLFKHPDDIQIFKGELEKIKGDAEKKIKEIEEKKEKKTDEDIATLEILKQEAAEKEEILKKIFNPLNNDNKWDPKDYKTLIFDTFYPTAIQDLNGVISGLNKKITDLEGEIKKGEERLEGQRSRSQELYDETRKLYGRISAKNREISRQKAIVMNAKVNGQSTDDLFLLGTITVNPYNSYYHEYSNFNTERILRNEGGLVGKDRSVLFKNDKFSIISTREKRENEEYKPEIYSIYTNRRVIPEYLLNYIKGCIEFHESYDLNFNFKYATYNSSGTEIEIKTNDARTHCSRDSYRWFNVSLETELKKLMEQGHERLYCEDGAELGESMYSVIDDYNHKKIILDRFSKKFYCKITTYHGDIVSKAANNGVDLKNGIKRHKVRSFARDGETIGGGEFYSISIGKMLGKKIEELDNFALAEDQRLRELEENEGVAEQQAWEERDA